MNEETLNMAIRSYLKSVGITSQRKIEYGIWKALENGTLGGLETLDVKMTLEVPAIGIKHRIDGKIALE